MLCSRINFRLSAAAYSAMCVFVAQGRGHAHCRRPWHGDEFLLHRGMSQHDVVLAATLHACVHAVPLPVPVVPHMRMPLIAVTKIMGNHANAYETRVF